MAMQEVSTLVHDSKKWPNKPLVGFYMNTTSYEDPTYHKTQYVHTFQKEDGSQISIYGYTTLDARMSKVPKGVLCKITYLGTEFVHTKSYGDKDVHQCSVMMDVDRYIGTDSLPEPAHAPASKSPDAPPARGKAGAATRTPAPAPSVPANDDPPF